MKLNRTIPQSSTLWQVLLLLACGFWILLREIHNPAPSGLTDYAGPLQMVEARAIRQVEDSAPGFEDLIGQLELTDSGLESAVRALIDEGRFAQARTLLLELAGEAVEAGRESQLANILLLLGNLAIDQQDLNNAELLLQEALEIALRIDHPLIIGRSYQQLGRLNIKVRALARYASEAYDHLWQIRNQIFLGEFRNAEKNLHQVIDASLEIKRYAAAAAALETLADFHARFHDDYQSRQASARAARIYAASGDFERAQRLLQKFEDSGMDGASIDSLQNAVTTLLAQYQADVGNAARARDLQMLYYYHLRRGEHQRAWQSRVESSRVLALSSERSMYQRQAEVMAILYTSNFAMQRAKRYLGRAAEQYARAGASDAAAQAEQMQDLIY